MLKGLILCLNTPNCAPLTEIDDGITQWHPAFLQLGKTLDECAAKYRKFCQKYRPKPKPETRNHWGSKLLAGMKVKKGKKIKKSPGQMSFPWAEWEATDPEIEAVAEKFILLTFCIKPRNKFLAES